MAATTIYALSTGWTELASDVQEVELQLQVGGSAIISVANSTPAADAVGHSLGSVIGKLTLRDLSDGSKVYGRSVDGASIAVTSGATSASAAGTAVLGKVDHTTTGLGHGHKEVTTAATPLALAPSTAAKWVTVQAYRSNTGYIAVGGSNTVSASATAGTGTGVSLAGGESITLPIDNLADVWIDASVSGEGVRYTYGYPEAMIAAGIAPTIPAWPLPVGMSGGFDLLRGEREGLALDFTTPRGRALVRDPTMSANNFNGFADEWLTQAGTSAKQVRDRDGTYRWSSHQLLINTPWVGTAGTNGAPAGWSWASQTGNKTQLDSLYYPGDKAWKFDAVSLGDRPYFQPSGASSIPAGMYGEGSVTVEAASGSLRWGDILAGSNTLTAIGYYRNGVFQSSSPADPAIVAPGDRISYVVLATLGNLMRMGVGSTTGGSAAAGASVTLSAPSMRLLPNAYSGYLRNPSTTAALYYPAFDCDPARGWALIIEPAATNLALSPGNWPTKTNLTVTEHAALAPNGLQDAALVQCSATVTSSLAIQLAAGASATANAYSIFAKKGTGALIGNQFALRNDTTSVTLIIVNINYDTGVLSLYSGGGAGYTYSSEPAANGFWRITVIATTGFSAGDNVRLYAGHCGGPSTAGDQVYIWAPQFTAGLALATSPIITAAATVTRAADNISRPVTAFALGSEWTVYLDFGLIGLGASAATAMWALSDNSLNEITYIQLNSTGTAFATGCRDGNVEQGALAIVSAPVAGARAQITAKFKLNDLASSKDGVAPLTDASATIPAPTTLLLGRATVGGSQIVQAPLRVRRMALVPRGVSNADLPTWRYAA